MSTTYGPQAATRADAARATWRTAATIADPAATAADRQTAAEREMAAYESYWHAHGVPAYAERSAREGLVREHATRGQAQIGAGHQAEAGDFEAGS
jgi:hypothetical protein